MSTIEEALEQLHHRTGKTAANNIAQAEKKASLLGNSLTAFIWYKGHQVQFVSLDSKQITFKNALVLLTRKREHAEFEHLCLLLIRSQPVLRE